MVIFCRRSLIVGIEFSKAQLPFELARGGVINRRHRTAGGTPRCPKIDDHRQIVAGEMALETRARQSNGLALEQRKVAAWAVRRVAQASFAHANDGVAMSANNVNFVAHFW